MRYLITISYDGSKFNGFQRLNHLPSVQGMLEKELKLINKKPVITKGAGRTDAGVHAMGQRVHFDLDVPIPVTGLKKRLNYGLMPYVEVTDCEIVKNDFHARFSVKEKTYTYKIYFGQYNLFLANYALFVNKSLDIRKMKKAAKLFLGKHDFENFVSGKRLNYDGTIFAIFFKRHKNFLEITFVGKSFYRYMVRNLVGCLLEIGSGTTSFLDVKNALDFPKKLHFFNTAPSQGLYLMKIKY